MANDDGTVFEDANKGRADDVSSPVESDGGAADSVGGTEKDSGTAVPVARDMLSARPFVRGARLWRDRGWTGTIPLPARQKNPPPTGWTGRNAEFPSNEQVSEWAKMAQYKRGNIGQHLGFAVEIVEGTVDVNGKLTPPGIYEVIGIDVDNYEDNGKTKEGAKQLAALEMQLGSLPRTYVSTARASRGDYDSGIRFYLVPRGLAFGGQADKDIEIIQKNHRFAVTWPSYNPKSDSQYCLYHPDEFFTKRNKSGDRDSDVRHETGQRKDVAAALANSVPTPLHEIPHVTTVPILPKKWLEHLTKGMMLDSDAGIDMDLSTDEVYDWAAEQFNDKDSQCAFMRKAVRTWKKRIAEEATSHDKILHAHWQIINLGAEGHSGWEDAMKEVGDYWVEDLVARDGKGRDAETINKEMWRSYTNAFRKVKKKVDNATSAGGIYTPPECPCVIRAAIVNAGGVVASQGGNAGGLFLTDEEAAEINDPDGGGPDDGLDRISWGAGKDPDEYLLNDDGNGEFLCDLLKYKSGRVKWVEGYGWILWTDATIDRPARWVLDTNGLVRRAFWRVRRLQEAHADAKYLEAEQLWDQTGNVTPMPALVKQRFAEAKMWREWARKSGNNPQANAAIEAAKKFPGVTMDINELNQHHYLLGVANGTVELRTDGAFRREAYASDFITFNTEVAWDSYSGIPDHDRGKKLWEEYLDQFIPVGRRDDYQTILGHCLIGGNPERMMLILNGGTSTGKSTMLRALAAALGDYASTVNLTIFGDHKLNPALANAMPRRVVFTSELSSTDKLSVATVKRMTGNDVVKAELKGSNVEVAGVPQFIPIMATNTPPEILGADEALRKRMVVLPFDKRIEDKKDEKRASGELEDHSGPAILAWLIDGYNMYCQRGIPRSDEIVKATDRFAGQLDPLSEFASEMLMPGSDDKHVFITDMYAAYKRWCQDSDLDYRERLTQQRFSRRLSDLGYGKKTAWIDGKAAKVWYGVKLRKTARIARTKTHMNSVKINTEKDMEGK